MERLGHRAAAAGRFEGGGVRVQAGHRGRTGLRRRLAQRRARADPGGGNGRREAVHRRGAEDATLAGPHALLQGDDREGRRRLHGGDRLSRTRRPAISARSRCAEPDGAHPVPRSPIRGGPGGTSIACARSIPKTCRCTTRRCSVTAAWATRKRPRAKSSCSCASRPRSRRRRSPGTRRGQPGRQQRTAGDSRSRRVSALPCQIASRRAVARSKPAARRLWPANRVIVERVQRRMSGGESRVLPRASQAWLRRPSMPQPGGVTFTDVTAAAGINFTHNSGRAGKKYLPETMGSGGGVLRRRRRRLARHLPRERPGLDAARAAVAQRALSQQPATARSRTSPLAAASTSRCTAWASPPATTTTTAATTSTSPRSKATACSTTRATASSAT